VVTDLLARSKVLNLTTTGRVTGHPHTVELWFTYHAGAKAVYLLAYPGPDGRGTDWYRNALAHPAVTLTVRGQSLSGRAVAPPEAEQAGVEKRLRDLFARKYGRATVSYWYGDEARLPLKIEIADPD
jgi:deazaflavin-dependent oxidoreductase (nitroreductase family)